ncbi:MAG TPA: cupin domain-containing protein [Ideonella sp.]|nr:cupin domain-containing protein [Ideonella sp.]
MTKISLKNEASALALAWRSKIVGQAAGANVKVVRMDGSSYPNEVHTFVEALLVLEGQMKLEIEGKIVSVEASEIFIVPAGIPHAVAPGSHGTLVIIDQ